MTDSDKLHLYFQLSSKNIFQLIKKTKQFQLLTFPPSDLPFFLKHPPNHCVNTTHGKHTPNSPTAHMSAFQHQVITSCGETRKAVSHSPTCTRCQEVATYLTDFIDLSNLLAGLLPGDSFLLRRKASRFFMSLALSERKIGGEREGGEV